MPTTSNFGWTTPADTDLVKDGAAAIRTLGNGIDSSLIDLKGGTTGQILAKASNTDLDFSWIANDQGDITAVTAGTGISGGGTSGAVTITNSMATAIDAKGDLIVGTGADTFDRLAVGTNGYTLVADSSTSTGLNWVAAPAGGKVLQVVQSTTSSAVSVASTTFTDTGLSASITPSSASSKVLILVAQKYYHYRENVPLNARLQIIRGATAILEFQNNSSRLTATLSGGYVDLGAIWSPVYLDSPNTTSSTTYKTQARTEDTTNAHQINFQGNSGTAVMILLEIGA